MNDSQYLSKVAMEEQASTWAARQLLVGHRQPIPEFSPISLEAKHANGWSNYPIDCQDFEPHLSRTPDSSTARPQTHTHQVTTEGVDFLPVANTAWTAQLLMLSKQVPVSTAQRTSIGNHYAGGISTEGLSISGDYQESELISHSSVGAHVTATGQSMGSSKPSTFTAEVSTVAFAAPRPFPPKNWAQPEDWERYKSKIIRLYLRQKMKLEDVIMKMKIEDGFYARYYYTIALQRYHY